MEGETPTYYAVLTADVRYDKRLSPSEKILCAEISALLNMNGECFASNKYFAELYDVTEKSVSAWVNHLEELGYFEIEYEYKGSVCVKRLIKLPKGKKEPNKQVSKKSNKEKKEVKATAPKSDAEFVQNTEIEALKEKYMFNYHELYIKGVVKTLNPIMNWGQAMKLLKDNLKKYGATILSDALEKSVNNEFVVSKGYLLSTILSASVLNSLINGNNFSNKKGFGTGRGCDAVTDDTVEF